MNDIGIVQLASWGDVFISTIISQGIKEKYPNSKITQYVSTSCANALIGNKHIDKIETIQSTKKQVWEGLQDHVINGIRTKHEILITPWPGYLPQDQWSIKSQINDNQSKHNFMWAYAKALENLGIQFDIPLKPQMWLTNQEMINADSISHRLNGFIVMMEVEGHSNQTYINHSWISPIANVISSKTNGKFTLLISRAGQDTREILEVKSTYGNKIITLGDLSLREVSRVFNNCHLFIGCSSGTSNACHAQHCRRDIPWIENIKSKLWDSTPLGVNQKRFHYDDNVESFIHTISDIIR